MPIDLALLGCAHPHVPDVLGVVASEPDLRLVAAWDADPSAVPMAISGVTVGRAEAAIRRAHAVVICAPADERPALVFGAAQAGRPLLVAHPLARTAAEARAVAREVARTGTPAAAALFLRQLPALQRLAGVIREGMLGRIAGATAALTHAGVLDGRFDGPARWMLDPARAGVGGFGDLALHLLDAFAALPGGREQPPTLAAIALDRPGAGRGDVGGMALGTWAGVPLSVRASWAVRAGGLEIAVTGAAGTATVRDGVLELARGGTTPERWVGAPPDAGEAVRAFAASLRTQRFPRDGLAPLVDAQRALESAVPVL